MSNHKNCNISFLCLLYTGFLLYFLSKGSRSFSFSFLIHKSCSVITERLVSLCNSSAFHDSRKFGGKKENSHKNLSAAVLSGSQNLSNPACRSSGNLSCSRQAGQHPEPGASGRGLACLPHAYHAGTSNRPMSPSPLACPCPGPGQPLLPSSIWTHLPRLHSLLSTTSHPNQ